MKLSTRSRYGVRLMTCLACANNGDKPVLLKDIAAAEEISEKYLSLIVIPLRAAGLIKSQRGARGGYNLARDPDKISLQSIIEAIEGEIYLVHCIKQSSGCNRSATCPTRDIWNILRNKIADTLNGITLAELAKIKNDKLAKVKYFNKTMN
jgi:Rrf2 family protein